MKAIRSKYGSSWGAPYGVEYQKSEILDEVGELAFRLVEHFGAVALEKWPSKDESANLLSPKDLVERCFNIAESFYDAARLNKHLIPVEEPEEVKKNV